MTSSLNIGILGHVDTGKTSLTRRIAEMGSTSAFDAHVSSEDVRRNTLDLGFSTMSVSGRRLALIDCPGHSGLIRAVLAASTVFDMAIVIIDVLSGIQQQTAEHLLLASLFCPDRVIVVLNKIDLAEEKNVKIENVRKKVRKGLKSMKISENSPILEMSLVDGHFQHEMLENLKMAIESRFYEPERDCDSPFLMAVDHCFSIKGKGTVLTGTVIRGSLKLNQEIELASQQEIRRVKTLESWKQKTEKVFAGERAAFLISSFEQNRFSRCLIGSPGCLKSVRQVIASVDPIIFFRNSLTSRTKLHVSVAFETLIAECQFLRPVGEGDEFEQLTHLEKPCQVLLTFEKSIFVPENFRTPFMVSKLEQQSGKGCRFAFSGHFIRILDPDHHLKRFTRKMRKGSIERVEKDGYSAICTGMFKAETNLQVFRDFQVITRFDGICGKIEGAFGKSGKFRVVFDRNISGIVMEKEEICMYMKKYLGDSDKLVSYVPDKLLS